MSDPIAPVAPAPATQEAPAAPAAATPAAPPPAPKVNPYARKPAPVAAAPAPEAPLAAAPTPAAKPTVQKGTRLLAMREAEIEKLKPFAEQNKAYAEALAPIAQEQLKALPDTARDKLAKQYKDNPLGLVQEINRLRDLGLLTQPAAQLPGATTALPKQPAATAVEADEDLLALRQWEDAKTRGLHTIAARLYSQNRPAIERGRQKAAARN